MVEAKSYRVAIIGAGSAGLFAARELAKNGIYVAVFNRDIKPGGLAEYGIYPDKVKMKEGLRKQFASCMDSANIKYFGNVKVGLHGDITLNDIRSFGFDAILVASGAQGTKWLGVPGEDLKGVYHAKDIVYHYNLLPPYSTKEYEIGKNVIIVGMGNVMMDIARYLIRDQKVEKVTSIARRGPAETKFSRKEMEYVGSNFDLDDYKNELFKATPIMRSIYQDPDLSLKFILNSLETCIEPNSSTIFCLKFLSSINSILGDKNDHVNAVIVEENTLIEKNGTIKAQSTGKMSRMDCDTVIFAIGDGVDPEFGLPMDNYEYYKNPKPSFPIEGISYEAFDPNLMQDIEDVFFAGWARKASDGLVGIARKDGINAAQAVLQYLETISPKNLGDPTAFEREFLNDHPQTVRKKELRILNEEEKRQAKLQNIEDFKFSSNEEMLKIIQENKVSQY